MNNGQNAKDRIHMIRAIYAVKMAARQTRIFTYKMIEICNSTPTDGGINVA